MLYICRRVKKIVRGDFKKGLGRLEERGLGLELELGVINNEEDTLLYLKEFRK